MSNIQCNYFNLSKEERINIFSESVLKTNRTFDFFIDYTKAEEVIKTYNIELNILNALVRNENYDEDFVKILKICPNVINLFPVLIALSHKERALLKKGKENLTILDIDKIDSYVKVNYDNDLKEIEYIFCIDENKKLAEEYIQKYLEFTKRVGIKYLLTNVVKKHIIDYIIGCEIGLDTNARKNRSGKIFEKLLEPLLKGISDKYNIKLNQQVKYSEFISKEVLIKELKDKKADFIFSNEEKILVIEANFFNDSGSKPNAIIESYTGRAEAVKNAGAEFLLITDGKKYHNETYEMLEKEFSRLDYILNYNMVKSGMLEDIVRETLLHKDINRIDL